MLGSVRKVMVAGLAINHLAGEASPGLDAGDTTCRELRSSQAERWTGPWLRAALQKFTPLP